MMPVIRISDATLSGLKALDQWFSKGTPSAVIDQLVKEGMEKYGIEHDEIEEAEYHDPSTAAPSEAPVKFHETPGLSHTKCLLAVVDGKAIESPNWSAILISSIAAVKAKGLSGKELAAALNINASPSRLDAAGYKFYPALSLSVQGQSAPDAWSEARRLAEKFGFDLSVTFIWRNKDGAAYPGKSGMMSVGSPK